MNYKEFDKGINSSCTVTDDMCKTIIEELKDKPKTVAQLSKEIFKNDMDGFLISPKLQQLKIRGVVSNVSTWNNVFYWGLVKEYRK